MSVKQDGLDMIALIRTFLALTAVAVSECVKPTESANVSREEGDLIAHLCSH